MISRIVAVAALGLAIGVCSQPPPAKSPAKSFAAVDAARLLITDVPDVARRVLGELSSKL